MADETAGAADAPSPAPAETASRAPAPVSASRAAAEAGDFAAFDKAAIAKQQGKPLPDVDPSAPAPAEGTDGTAPGESGARTVSRRQQAINDYERRIAEQEQRIRALESRRPDARPESPREPPPSNGHAPGADPANGQPPAAETAKQRIARYLALPDAPQVADFDTYPEYTAAQALFLQDAREAEQAAVAAQRQQQQQRHQQLIARDQGFRERLTAAKTADPAFVESLSDEAKNLGGIDHARRSGVEPGPIHIIGELLYDSPQAVPFLRAISADPALLASLVALPASLAQLPPAWRAKAHVDHLVTEFRRLEGRLAYQDTLTAPDHAARADTPPLNLVSSAPPPPPTLGKAGHSTDPARSALARGDFEAFDRAEMAKRRRQRAAGGA
jgi:hypothetical protein